MTQKTHSFRVRAGGPLRGSATVPGDKSISHRAVMFGALADGTTTVEGFLQGEDCLATRRAFEAMGVVCEDIADAAMRIHGVGLHGLSAPGCDLDLGNSGTSMRLMCGLLSGQSFSTTLSGDASLSRRPMRRVTDPLSQMGARIDATDEGTAPLRIHGGQPLSGRAFQLSIASAQVKSALLLAGLYADGTTRVDEPGISRDHTERMLTSFGVDVPVQGRRCSVRGGQRLTATRIEVPADLSSATFPLVAAAITPQSDISLPNVGVNPSRAGVLKILEMMGAQVELTNVRAAGAEPVADLRIRASALHGVDIPPALVPLAIDEFPALLVAAACAQGRTRITGAAELRVKESDRIAAMAAGLQAVGVTVEEQADGITVQGGGVTGGVVESHDDHRIAMAFAALGSVAPDGIEIRDVANVRTSFPGFVPLMAALGLVIEEAS
ncbi:MAG: 3-phosphoshikimate 1-carboxyvinyltransferase [Abyssibacter sp.]|uniref:3-phosphoshikimate 1-carboxyvinyltransferase n=1 Tax=Abyssibacter sp. TaxID=2320200 RepID=UPI003219041E